VGGKRRGAKGHPRGQIIGRLSMTRHGYGFVEGPEGDFFIPAKDVGGAMHGDLVAVRPEAHRGRQGRAGAVAKVIERANTTLVGRFDRHGGIGIVSPIDRRVRHDVFVASNGMGEAESGDIVVVRLTAYPSRAQAAQGYVEEIVGREGDPGLEIEIIIREHGLRTEFPLAAAEQAASIKLDVDEALASEPDRIDIRERFTFTIDPADARDFDDAISIEHEADGRVRLGVHIADVSHYVPWDCSIDNEARLRATSVYLVDRVLPMLPEQLSNGICSLNPGEDRVCFSVDMTLSKDGVVEEYRIFPSVIRSDRRFSYGQVDSWLSGAEPFPDKPSEQALVEFSRVSAKIGERRVARGGLDFETVEAKIRLDDGGIPLEVVLRERTVATNSIEEAMIAANEVVARHMRDAKAPMIYRIHEDPDPEALDRIALVLREFDYPIKDVHGASPATFQRIVKFAHNRPEKLLINSLLLRALERARYVDYLAPHFGLASEAYTHFTSPIRRYPDLIVHRLLKAQLRGTLDSDADAVGMIPELAWLAEHSSHMEREAEHAENDSVRFKLCELMAGHIDEVFPGIITGVTSFGLFVQLENTAEGLVHVDSIPGDHYHYEAAKHWLLGEKHGERFRLGQAVDVRILNVSLGDARIDMEIA
jgi:ribonuclease R